MHSPTPWKPEPHSAGYYIKDKNGVVVADVSDGQSIAIDKTNAYRIARAVNAVSEISDDMIEAFRDEFSCGYWSAYSDRNGDRIRAALKAMFKVAL